MRWLQERMFSSRDRAKGFVGIDQDRVGERVLARVVLEFWNQLGKCDWRAGSRGTGGFGARVAFDLCATGWGGAGAGMTA